MNGEQLFYKLIESGDDYARFLITARLNVGSALFPLLEKAEEDGSILELNEEDLPDEWDGFGVESIVLKKKVDG